MMKPFLNTRSPYLHLAIMVLSITILSGLYVRASKENDRLTWEIEKMESAMNCSHDRLRFIYLKHRAEFIDMAEYLDKNYGSSFYYIAYKGGRLSMSGTNSQQDDEKIIRFFENLQKEIVLYKERSDHNKMEITRHKNENDETTYTPFFVEGISFNLYKNTRNTAGIKFGNSKMYERAKSQYEYMIFHSSFSIINAQWSSIS